MSTGIHSYALSGGAPVDLRSWRQWQELEPLLRHLWELATTQGWWPNAMFLAANYACYLVETGQVKEADLLLGDLESCSVDLGSAETQAAYFQARGLLALETGDFANAESCFSKASQILPPGGVEHALMLCLRGSALRELARIEGKSPTDSEPLYRAALSCPSLTRADSAQIRSNLAMCLAEMGREADALHKSTLAMKRVERDFGPDHPITASILNNHATLLPDLDADPLLRRALAILDACHQGVRTCAADVLVNLAAKRCASTAEEALGWLSRALGIYRTNLGVSHAITSKLAADIEAWRELLR